MSGKRADAKVAKAVYDKLKGAAKKRGRTKFDPLSNKGTTNVFFALIDSPKTPTEMAAELGIGPSSVVEQLDRLLEIGAVKLHEKRGRLRFYGIDWIRFARLFLEELVYFKLAPELENVRKLEKNPYFQGLLKTFYQVEKDGREILKDCSPTIHDTVFEFEKRLIGCPKFREDLPSASRERPFWLEHTVGLKHEMGEFLSLLEKLRRHFLRIKEAGDPLFEGLTER